MYETPKIKIKIMLNLLVLLGFYTLLGRALTKIHPRSVLTGQSYNYIIFANDMINLLFLGISILEVHLWFGEGDQIKAM